MEKVNAEFRHLKSEAKGKAAKILKEKGRTGGGECEEYNMDSILEKLVGMSDWEKKLVSSIGADALVGIKGGVDTASKKTKSSIAESIIDAVEDPADYESNKGNYYTQPGSQKSGVSAVS
jgi:hypothetical protein